eukprot:TRINITY_DN25495_c0_g1_i1.p1 TRINITY_DN25495_c0_g1~~TRINITY_DN25495_c0_g1_i1.p1  ORF type:complete len:440 (-),score=42.13 TRINITY_DN25495_c0_g1_i1:89-1372(-)
MDAALVPPPAMHMSEGVPPRRRGSLSPRATSKVTCGPELSDKKSHFLKEFRYDFMVLGIQLLVALSFFPLWTSSRLLNSSMYIYFSDRGFPIGACLMLLVTLAFIWNTLVRRSFAFLSPRLIALLVAAFCIMVALRVLPLCVLGGLPAAKEYITTCFGALWFGCSPAATILACCGSIVVMYFLFMRDVIAEHVSPLKTRVSTLLIIWGFFVGILSVWLILYSLPIIEQAENAHRELITSCESGPRTRNLYITSQALQSLRQTPGCSAQVSVEQCLGFEVTVYSNVLKELESKFKCAGFCYDVGRVKPLGTSSAGGSLSARSLFSRISPVASCDSMAARAMMNSVRSGGWQILRQGLLTLFISMSLALLYLVYICRRNGDTVPEALAFAPGNPSYGPFCGGICLLRTAKDCKHFSTTEAANCLANQCQ